jgi:hypothetical protein
MHKLIPLKLKIAVVLALGSIIALIASLITDSPLSILLIAGIIEIILLLLGAYSWRLLCCKLSMRPAWMIDLSGTWEGNINSRWKKNPDDPPLPPIPTKVEIRQDWLNISIRLITDKISSKSSGELPEFDKKTRQLSIKYFYDTDPKAEFSAENPPQRGCAYLTLCVDKPDEMTIRYTNDRGLGGDITLQRLVRIET